MARKLVIVESPAKAKKIGGFLGSDYVVDASAGHIRDLPTPSELPADEVVPFEHLALNARRLPSAAVVDHRLGGHQFDGVTIDLG